MNYSLNCIYISLLVFATIALLYNIWAYMQLKSGEVQKLAMIYSELEKEKYSLLKNKNIPSFSKKTRRQIRIIKIGLLSIQYSFQEIINLLKNK